MAWFQKQYRRLVVRWERIAACFDAFLAIATIHVWMHRLIVGYILESVPGLAFLHRLVLVFHEESVRNSQLMFAVILAAV